MKSVLKCTYHLPQEYCHEICSIMYHLPQEYCHEICSKMYHLPQEYFHLFRAAGYDMPTISRMTPEDLTAIGIKKPHHRKRLKSEIGRLNIGDGLPGYLPASLEEWLRLLRLEEYGPQLRAQGYHTVQAEALIDLP